MTQAENVDSLAYAGRTRHPEPEVMTIAIACIVFGIIAAALHLLLSLVFGLQAYSALAQAPNPAKPSATIQVGASATPVQAPKHPVRVNEQEAVLVARTIAGQWNWREQDARVLRRVLPHIDVPLLPPPEGRWTVEHVRGQSDQRFNDGRRSRNARYHGGSIAYDLIDARESFKVRPAVGTTSIFARRDDDSIALTMPDKAKTHWNHSPLLKSASAGIALLLGLTAGWLLLAGLITLPKPHVGTRLIRLGLPVLLPVTSLAVCLMAVQMLTTAQAATPDHLVLPDGRLVGGGVEFDTLLHPPQIVYVIGMLSAVGYIFHYSRRTAVRQLQPAP